MALKTRKLAIMLIVIIGALVLFLHRRQGVLPSHLDHYLLGLLDSDEGAPSSELMHPGLVSLGMYPKVVDHRVQWEKTAEMPKTKIVRHITGWTVFENLYAHNGTFYIVTDNLDEFPPIREMISTGYPMLNSPEDQAKREPTANDMQIISTRKATQTFGPTASHVVGVSFVANDAQQFVAHYYHFCAEIFFGLWRTYSSLDVNITPNGDTYLPAPNRFIFPHLEHSGWRDKAKMNHVILRGAFPSASVETIQDWQDRASTEQLYLFDLVVLTERTAATRGKNYSIDDKMAAMAHRLPGSAHWWAPIRMNVLEFAGLPRGLDGRIQRERKPVITYIVRQGRGRALDPASHRGLSDALNALAQEFDWEVNIAMMEKLKKVDQIKLLGRTTILIGVHGNGLTSLLWMQPNPRSTVIEIFIPGGFTSDYQMPAQALGIEHYGVWNDTYFRSNSSDKPRRTQPAGFHGNKIPVNPSTIATIVVERILEPGKFSSKVSRSVPEERSEETPEASNVEEPIDMHPAPLPIQGTKVKADAPHEAQKGNDVI